MSHRRQKRTAQFTCGAVFSKLRRRKRGRTETPGPAAPEGIFRETPAPRKAFAFAPQAVWRYRGQAYRLDMNDADDAERYRACLLDMEKRRREATADAGHADGIRAFCGRMRLFFDALFGEGAGLAIVGEKDNAGNVVHAFSGLCAHVAGQGGAYADTARAIWEAAERPARKRRRRQAVWPCR